MKMSIEEAIEFKKHGYHTPLSSFEKIEDMNAQISKCAEYDRLVLDTMRKYQKIESKIKVLRHFTEDTPLATQRMIKIVNEIVEVLEDGLDNAIQG